MGTERKEPSKKQS